MNELLAYILELESKLIDLRRDFHHHPELGFEEYRTGQQVEKFLSGLGLEVNQVQETGVIGLLDCGAGPTVALRADMDALPIPEQTELSYSSSQPGIMHACGHDGHTAMLLIAAQVLTKFKDRLQGKVKFIFQPAEEGPGGALPLIESGVLNSPDVDQIFGLHINNQLPTGTVGVQPTTAAAAADEIEILIKGKSGHASTPQVGVDAILVASQVVSALHTINSRELAPDQQVVINLGTIEGGYRRNIIADQVKLTGTIRTTDPEVRADLPDKVERIIAGTTASYNGDYQLDYQFGYPVLENTYSLVEELEPVIADLPDIEQVQRINQSSLGSEDFAYYLQQIPGVFFRLGAAKPETNYYPAHHPQFDFDEAALKNGVALFVAIVVNKLTVS